jgi:ribosome biogenesis ATPase
MLVLTATTQDFLLAIKKVQPSAKREGFATTPNVSWDEVGALEHVRYVTRPPFSVCLY